MNYDELVFLDTETTGLNPTIHQPWEVAAIIGDLEIVWHLPLDVRKADLIALNIGGFHERYKGPKRWENTRPNETKIGMALDKFAEEFQDLTWGKHLVGAIPSFDADMIAPILRDNHAIAGWHYHLIDIESMALAKFGFDVPWKSDQITEACGLTEVQYEKHTALGDARWARDCFMKMVGT